MQEIKQATSIVDNELQRQLQSLACAKFKILKKHPPGREVDPSDSFSFNADFSSNLQKIKISTISSKVESGEERKETKDRIDEERRHQTEVCNREMRMLEALTNLCPGLHCTDNEGPETYDP
jgi:cullin 3